MVHPDLESYIRDLLREEERLAQRVAALQQQLRSAEQQLESVADLRAKAQAVSADYRERYGLSAVSETPSEELAARFKGLTTRQGLVLLARDNGGLLVGRDACNALVAAGVFKDYQGAANSVYSALSRSADIFEKDGKGRYRLREPSYGQVASVSGGSGDGASAQPVPMQESFLEGALPSSAQPAGEAPESDRDYDGD